MVWPICRTRTLPSPLPLPGDLTPRWQAGIVGERWIWPGRRTPWPRATQRSIKENYYGWKSTANGPQTGDQVLPPAEENGKEPDRCEDQQKEKMKSPP